MSGNIDHSNTSKMSGISKKSKIAPKTHSKGGEKAENEVVSVINDKLTTDELFKLADLYFNTKFVMYAHMRNSFNKFIEEDIPNFLKNNDNTFFEKITKDQDIRYKFEFDDIVLKPPTMGSEFMFPSDAREKNFTYSATLQATVTQIQEIYDIYTKELVSRKIVENPEKNVPVAILPIMVRSNFCSLNLENAFDRRECDYDPGCYFIINGAEKVVISQERMCENKPLVFLKKDSSSQIYVAQVNSRSHKDSGMMQVMMINLKNNGSITLRVPILNEFPIIILFRALGIESDRSIIDYIVYDKNDDDMISAVIKAIRLAVDNDGKQIKTQSDAINYLANNIRVAKRYTETDKKIRQEQKRMHVEFLLENNFLPHVTGGKVAKIYFIGYMINKLLNCALGRTPLDDRDSYLNKRVDLVGNLLEKLFRQFFRKMLNECNKYFKKRNITDEEPINIIGQIRPNTIEQGINASLRTGNWGDKKGVAQVLQRLTYLQAIEFFRRIDSPSNDASASKLTHPRHLHGTQNGNLCCVVGNTKVLLGDGVTMKMIKDFDGTEEVMTINPNNLIVKVSQIHNFFEKQPNRLLEIITSNGNILKCTDDHQLLVNSHFDKNIWMRADQLRVNDKLFLYQFPNIYYNVSNECSMDNCSTYLEGNSFAKCNKVLTTIVSISIAEIEPVYDFTTNSDNHSFIANGIIVHNCVETPEHAKVGLVKHLTLLGSVTVPIYSQNKLIREILSERVKKLDDVFPSQMLKYTKVFINGDWIGLTENPIKLYDHIKKMKYDGSIEYTTSIIFDDTTNEIKVYCDGGRLYRPVIRVEDNNLLLTKEHIKLISLDKIKSETLITSWNAFMQRNSGIIEYIDSEEQYYSMIAQDVDTLYEMKQKQIDSMKLAKDKEIDRTNRYGEKTFVNYSHCEIHPSLLLGVIATNIPFLNHNQGPRNIFQYAQGRQAVCIYASNYRYRIDTSMILYHPQKPLVNSRTGKYMYNDILSPGENAVVAIACYTGYNQEDSIVINKSAIDRGLLRSASFNKYISIIQKNRSTSQDDQFMKPEPNKVSKMGQYSHYDKLNEKGYVPEETTVYNGDYIIGKVSPVQKTQTSNKEYKDSSEAYKQHVPGVVDKVYSDIRNVEGYEMKKMRIRSDRRPTNGDKMCCYTPEHEVLTNEGWTPINLLTLNDKVACLIDGKRLEYHYPTALQSYNYDGNVYVVENKYVNLRVTSNHRMYVGYDACWTGKFQISEAQDIVGRNVFYKKHVDEYNVRNNHVLNDEQMNDIFNEIDKSGILTIPEEYLKLNMEQSRKIVEHILIHDYDDFDDEIVIDNLQILCLHAGISADITISDDKCSICINDYPDMISVNNDPNNLDDYCEEYSGKVYCCSVPNDGIIYVRRQGVPVWCGNSRHG